MSLSPMSPDIRATLRHELAALRGSWAWFLALGIVLVVLGTLAVGAAGLTTLASMMFLSVLMIMGGISQIVGAFWARYWSGFFTLLLTGILYLAAGVLTIERPVVAAEALTMVIAMFFVVGGVFRLAAAISMRFPNWGWMALDGAITIALGLMIWRRWPESSFTVIGLFVGLSLIMNGWTWVIIGLSLRKVSRVLEARAETGV